MKKKHNMSGEDSRYQGTLLGKEADEHQPVILAGGPASIEEWNSRLEFKAASAPTSSLNSSPFSSSPLTPMDDTFGEDES